MAKSNTNSNVADVTNVCAITPTIHLVLQGKGGVGKTVVAGWLSKFLIERGQPVHCIDGDPVNRSLAQYKALPVEKLDLINQDGVVMRSRYDALVDRFVKEEAVFVVDNGATAFLPFWTYFVEANIPAVLREAGRRVYVHIPISGGEMLNDTLLGFKTLAETAAEKSLVVWLNEYFGAVARDGKSFDQMQVYLDNREKVLASVGIRGKAVGHVRRECSPDARAEANPSKRQSGRRPPSTSWKSSVCAWCAGNCSNNWN